MGSANSRPTSGDKTDTSTAIKPDVVRETAHTDVAKGVESSKSSCVATQTGEFDTDDKTNAPKDVSNIADTLHSNGAVVGHAIVTEKELRLSNQHEIDQEIGNETRENNDLIKSKSLKENKKAKSGKNVETRDVSQQTYDHDDDHDTLAEPRSYDEVALQRFGKYKVRLPSDNEKCIVTAAVFLDTGDLVVIDRSNQKIKFVDSQFKFISSQELPAKPWAVCARGVDIYVTIGYTQIQHLCLREMIIEPERIIEVNERCLSLCIFGEYITVGLQIGELSLLDTMGKVHDTIKLPSLENGKPCSPWHICVSAEQNFLVTDSDVGILFCININSEIVFKYTSMSSPRGADIDFNGNIILIGRDTDTGDVIRILPHDTELQQMLNIEESADTRWRSLMTWEEMEFVPYCVSYRDDHVLVVGGIQESLKKMKLL